MAGYPSCVHVEPLYKDVWTIFLNSLYDKALIVEILAEMPDYVLMGFSLTENNNLFVRLKCTRNQAFYIYSYLQNNQ